MYFDFKFFAAQSLESLCASEPEMHGDDEPRLNLADDVEGFFVAEGHRSIDGNEENVDPAQAADLFLVQKMMKMTEMSQTKAGGLENEDRIVVAARVTVFVDVGRYVEDP